jgi:hypothetical protein
MFNIQIDYPTSSRNEPRYLSHATNPYIDRALEANLDVYRNWIAAFERYFDKLRRIPAESESMEDVPSYANCFLPGLDCVALYCLIAEIKPRIYLEVGSGNSTKFVRRSILDNHLETKIISIDPEPRVGIDKLCDEIYRKSLEDTPLTLFDRLGADDILFIDNSHRCFMNSDVTVCFLDVMPRLAPGVFLQLHDIFWPVDYPAEWRDRYYNEQYILGALLANGLVNYDIVFPAYFVAQNPEFQGVMDRFWKSSTELSKVERHGGSFWMRKK